MHVGVRTGQHIGYRHADAQALVVVLTAVVKIEFPVGSYHDLGLPQAAPHPALRAAAIKDIGQAVPGI